MLVLASVHRPRVRPRRARSPGRRLGGRAARRSLDEAMAARVVSDVPGGPGRLRFAHVLIRDTLYEGLTTARRVRLHRLAVEALEALYGDEPGPHLAELAHHAIAGQRLRQGPALRLARRRPRARAARLRGGCAPVRDGPGCARARATVETSRTRCELLLVARRGGGSRGRHSRPRSEPSSTPPDIARRLGLPRELARAAAGYGGRFMWARAAGDDRLVPLLEEGLAALGEEDVELRARLLARLAGALRDEPSRDRRDRLSREAVELARRGGNPAALAYALDGRARRHHRPGHGRRVPRPRPRAARCRRADRRHRAGRARADHHGASMQLMRRRRSREAEAASRDAMAASPSELRQPAQLWQVYAAQRDARSRGGQVRPRPRSSSRRPSRSASARSPRWRSPSTGSSATHSATSRGGSRRSSRRSATSSPSTRPGQSSAARSPSSTHGSDTSAEAQRALDDLAQDDFSALPFDQEWLYGMSLLAETSALLGDSDSAAVLYRLLLPWAAFNAADHPEGFRGSISRYLGLLATTRQRWEEAELHFEDALATNARMGARPWLAHTAARLRADAARPRRSRRSRARPSAARCCAKDLPRARHGELRGGDQAAGATAQPLFAAARLRSASQLMSVVALPRASALARCTAS